MRPVRKISSQECSVADRNFNFHIVFWKVPCTRSSLIYIQTSNFLPKNWSYSTFPHYTCLVEPKKYLNCIINLKITIIFYNLLLKKGQSIFHPLSLTAKALLVIIFSPFLKTKGTSSFFTCAFTCHLLPTFLKHISDSKFMRIEYNIKVLSNM